MVERVREEPELVRRLRRHVDVEASGAHRARRAHQPSHRRDEAARQQERRDHGDDDEQADHRQCAQQMIAKALLLPVRRQAEPHISDQRTAARRGDRCRELDESQSADHSLDGCFGSRRRGFHLQHRQRLGAERRRDPPFRYDGSFLIVRGDVGDVRIARDAGEDLVDARLVLCGKRRRR